MAKRTIDIIFSLIAIVFLAIPMLGIALSVRLQSAGPILFWSERVGRHGVVFLMPKFRTMDVGAPVAPTDKLESPNSYITPLGSIMRRYSLDELPQIFSVLLGDMSLVGPRPMLPMMHDVIVARRARGVEELRPGITGWAQVNGRDNLSNEQKIGLDVEYLDRQSLWFDLYIIQRTIVYVSTAKGVWH